MRKLASVQVVTQVEPILNADAIERVCILGRWVVVRKGDFRRGDKVVYCEVGSLLPVRPEFEFLRKSSFKPEIRYAAGRLCQPAGFRIKAVKLRGQVSQGICFPLSVLPARAPREEGADVSEFLAVGKYEPHRPVYVARKVKGDLSGSLSRPDEQRVQVVEPFLARHARAILRFLTQCVLDGGIGVIVGGAMSLPFGLMGWILTKEVIYLAIAGFFGGLIGGLHGIGQVLVEYFSEQAAEPDQSEENTGWELVSAFYLRPLLGLLLGPVYRCLEVFEIAKWFATKDFSKQKPGRWKRAVIGAIAMWLFAGFLAFLSVWSSPGPVPEELPLAAAAIVSLTFAAMGAVLGALTDSR
jgi:hypothetical protein